jgi:predicted O-linked N-acetylglucosamine transferase (SPINDLY family)
MSLPIDKAIRKAQSHIKAGELAEAEELYKQVLSKFPKNKKAIQGYQKLKAGVTSNASSNSKPHQEQIQELINLYNQGQFEKVLEKVKPLISLFPKAINLHNIHGASNAALQRYDAAIDSYNQAIKIKPDYAEAYNNLGIALKDTGDFNAAIDSYKRAIKIKPDYADAYYNMGNALKGKGEFNAAIDSYKQAIKIKPDYAEAYYNMGIALQDKGELDASIDSHKQAIKIKPDYAEAHNNMGAALTEKGELDAAIDSYKQAIKIKPDYAEAYYNMGIALKGKGELDATIDSCKQAIKIKPDYEIARTQKLHQQAHICDWAALEQDQHLISKLGTLTQYVDPFAVLSLEDAPERHRLRSELYAKQNFKQKPLPLAPRSTQKPDRLRIGYFSADFHNHATMYLMAKVFEAHDPEKFELYAYSFGPDKNDEMRQRLIHAVDVFDDVKEMSDKDIALLARQDKIDIAVDLKGFTKDQRTGIFAYCAAPIQISYLGYPGTMGADFIDYIIADKVVIPPIHQPSYSESIIYLPYSYQVNDNTRVISERSLTRIEMGLPEQGFVFCCFNPNYKISPAEFYIWMRLLGKVEGSVLWLLKSNKWSEDNLRLEAENLGISSERLIFAEKKPQAEHLARHRLADLFIDTFNVNAHTTTSDALWAGLPVVTKLGKGFAARVAGSLLSAIDMSELITETEQEYESLILDLATNPERLGAIKLKLAANRLSKPLFNTELFTKHLEDGYQRAYQQYFDGKEPEAIYVPEQV